MRNGEKEKFFLECWNDIQFEPKIQKEIESYDEIMEQRPKYKIWYNLGLAFDSKVNRLKNIIIGKYNHRIIKSLFLFFLI